MSVLVETDVNGLRRSDHVEPRLLLVDYLRSVLGLTGTHVGCDTSACGACTVWLDGRAVKSCTVLAAQVSGHEVTTIEGLSDGDSLHPVQQAFTEEHALQCGYCTPGFIMAIAAFLQEVPDPSEEDLLRAMEGNLCRCTGYLNIVKAARAASVSMRAAKSADARRAL